MIDKEKLLNSLQDDVDAYNWIINSNKGMGGFIDNMAEMKAAKEVLIENIKEGTFDFPLIKIKILDPETCRWRKEQIKFNCTVPYQLHDWYTDCGRVAQLKDFYIFYPLCGKPIEEVRGE